MKTSRLLAAGAASAALALSPAAAFAGGLDPYNDNEDAIIIPDQTPENCTFPVTVTTDVGVLTITLTVRDANNNVVYTDTVSNNPEREVTFQVDLGDDCDGSYSISATDQTGAVIAESDVTVDDDDDDDNPNPGPNPGPTTGGVDNAGGDTGNNVGGLPSTGSSDALILSGLAGAGLLAGGSVLLVRRRRATA